MKTHFISTVFTLISFLSLGQDRNGFNSPCQIKLVWEMIERDIKTNYDQSTHSYKPSYYSNKNYSILLKAQGYIKSSYRYQWIISGIQNGFKYNSGIGTHPYLFMTNGDLANNNASIDEFKTRIGPSIPDLTRYEVLLTISENGKQICRKRLMIKPKNHLIVSLGDSYASGEGLPDKNGSYECDYKGDLTKTYVNATWLDEDAHRSLKSSHAKVVKELQKDKHSTITFLSFASSGAGILDGILFPQEGKEIRESQLDQLQEAIESRAIDVLLMSIGGNDIGWSGIFEELVTSETNHEEIVDERLDELRRRYEILGDVLNSRGIVFRQGLLMEYPELLFGNDNGEVTKGCGKFRDYPLTGERIDFKEASFIYESAQKLNQVVLDGANIIRSKTNQKFFYQGGIANEYLSHGYCSSDSYYVFFNESCRNQGGKDGVLHPNEKGTKATAEILLKKIGSLSDGDTRINGSGIGVGVIN